jgi:hypothetical protein
MDPVNNNSENGMNGNDGKVPIAPCQAKASSVMANPVKKTKIEMATDLVLSINPF